MVQTEEHSDMQNNTPLFDIKELANCLSEVYKTTSDIYKFHMQKINSLYESAARDNIDIMMIGKYNIYIDMMYEGEIIKCMFDTGSQKNIMTTKIVDKLGIQDCIDISFRKDKIYGVTGSIESNGFIPYLSLSLNNYIFPSCFTVLLIEQEWNCLIGILFMRFYNVCIDFNKNQLHIGGQCIPFRLANK